jgi:hypothetical protein
MLVQDSETVRICAVLHYVLEDTPVTREDLLREGFSLEIVTALEALSERPGEDYELFINRILGNELACRVKAADIGDNMNLDRLAEITAKDLERVKRYQRALEKITANKGRDSMNPGELFLREHGVGHTFRVVGNSFLNIDKLLTLPEQALRTHPQGLNSLAWLFWDMTRVEDGCLAAVVAGVEQVLDQGDWAGKLGVSRRDVGTGMSKVEAAELSQRIDLAALWEYREQVGLRTRVLVQELWPQRWFEPLVPEDLVRAAGAGVLSGQEHWLLGSPREALLYWWGLNHTFIHMGQVMLVRELLQDLFKTLCHPYG